MSKLMMKLTGVDKAAEFVGVKDIIRMVTVPESKAEKGAFVPQHTAVYLVGQADPIKVTQTAEYIVQEASRYSEGMNMVK